MRPIEAQSEPPLVSVIVPARDEESNIGRLHEELGGIIDELPYEFEVIVVDNDSSDGTGALVKGLCRRDSRWKYLRLSRDFGAEASITAGYDHARGDVAIVLYADLQDPPSLIAEFLAKWEQGFDVVYGVQTARRGESAARGLFVRGAYRMLARVADVDLPPNTSHFRLVTRQVLDALSQMGDRNRYVPGQIAWLGFRRVGVPYERRPRVAGRSKSSRAYLVRYFLDALFGVSLRPLRAIGVLAVLLGLVAVVWGAVIALLAIGGHSPSSVSLVGLLALALAALNMAGLWIVGEYLGRVHVDSRRRPAYVPAEAINIAPRGDG